MLAFETGEELMRAWYDAERRQLDPFVLVLEGSVPNEEINGDGHWAGFGVDPATGQPITTCRGSIGWRPKAAAVMAIGTCAAYGGIPAMRNNPTGAMGLRDYLGCGWTSRLGIPIVNLPGCPVQPNNITETLLALVLQLGGLAPMIDLDDQGRPRWLFDRTVHEICNRAGFAEAGPFTDMLGDDERCLVKLGCKGPVVRVQRPRARLGQRRSAAARTSAASASAAPPRGSPIASCRSRSPTASGWPTSRGARFTYGPVLRYFRDRRMRTTFEREPAWRRPATELLTGHERRW